MNQGVQATEQRLGCSDEWLCEAERASGEWESWGCPDTCGLRGGCQHTVRGSTFHIKRKDLTSFSQIFTGSCKVKL